MEGVEGGLKGFPKEEILRISQRKSGIKKMECVWWGGWGRRLQRGNSFVKGRLGEDREHSVSCKVGQGHGTQNKTEAESEAERVGGRVGGPS